MNSSKPEQFTPAPARLDHHHARLANRNNILRSLIARGPASRAELARRTGLSRPTVSVIASDLLDSGVVTEGSRISSGGAPGTLLELSKDTGVTVVADVRDTNRITLAKVAAGGTVSDYVEFTASSTQQARDLITEYVEQEGCASLIGTTVAVRGFVSPAGEWEYTTDDAIDPSIITELRRSLPMPVLPVNAIDAITIADLRDSPEGLTGHATVVVPEATSGLIIEGNLLTGWRRPVGVITHVVPGLPGPQCPVCGKVCLYAHTQALLADPSAANRRKLAAALAAVMAPIVVALELEQVVLAGVPETIATSMAEQTLAELESRMEASVVPTVRVSNAGKEAVLTGAAAMMLFSRLA